MQTEKQRERLVELLIKCDKESEVLDCFNERPKKTQSAELIADYLMSNNVVVLPCKIGEKLYYINVYADCEDCDYYCDAYEWGDIPECLNEPKYPIFPTLDDYISKKCCPKHKLEIKEAEFSFGIFRWTMRELGKTVFLSRAEAENVLKERKNEK